MDTKRERAVAFLDPFGASVDWTAIEAISKTKAVDLWILFPYAAINRMLTRDRKPSPSWSDKLTRVFGTALWEDRFYSSHFAASILDPSQEIESVRKTAGRASIVSFFIEQLRTIFAEVAEPGLLFNSRGLLFALFSASNNKTAIKIANDLMRDIGR